MSVDSSIAYCQLPELLMDWNMALGVSLSQSIAACAMKSGWEFTQTVVWLCGVRPAAADFPVAAFAVNVQRGLGAASSWSFVLSTRAAEQLWDQLLCPDGYSAQFIIIIYYIIILFTCKYGIRHIDEHLNVNMQDCSHWQYEPER